MELRPLGNNVIVEPYKEETKTDSGIVLPDTMEKERPEKGKVVAIGEGVEGKMKKGDMIIFKKYAPDELLVKKKEYLIVSEEDILAVIDK